MHALLRLENYIRELTQVLSHKSCFRFGLKPETQAEELNSVSGSMRSVGKLFNKRSEALIQTLAIRDAFPLLIDKAYNDLSASVACADGCAVEFNLSIVYRIHQ